MKARTKTLFAAILALAGAANAVDYSAWTGHQSIVLNTSASGAAVAGTVTNFPVLIRLGSAESAILAATSASIRFSKADNATPLPYQIESWSSTAAAIWVKVDSIKGNNATQSIRIHYLNGAAVSESNGAAVFDTAQYVAVWHLTDSSDATGRGNTGVPSPTAPTNLAASLIGSGKTFNGTSNWYQIGTDSTAINMNTETGPYTVTAWVNPAACDARIAAIAKYTNGATPPGRQFALHTNSSFTDWRFTNGSTTVAGEFTADAPGSCVINTWSHIVGVYKSGTPTTDSSINAKIYVNGVLAGQGASVTTTGAGRQANAYIGRIHGTERYMNGSLDEITLAKVARDTNWIKLAYKNQSAVNMLANIGSFLTLTAPGAPTGVTGVSGPSQVAVTWVAPTSTGGTAITQYKAYAVSDTTKACTTTGALTCTVTGLTNGTAYTFQVKATNAVGTGVASTASGSVTPALQVPGAPTGVTAANTSTSGAIAVTWVAPASNGGAAISGYKAMAVSDTTKNCTTTGTLTCTITGLTVGTSYTFVVKATNSVGTSAASTASSAVTGVVPGSLVFKVGTFSKAYTFQLPENLSASVENLTLTISDVSGKTVWEKTVSPGRDALREISWNGLNAKGTAVSAGMYVARAKVSGAAGSQETLQLSVKLRK